MEKIRIFCEGVSDQRFLRDFIELHYGLNISDKDLKDNKYIHRLNGWSNLEKLKTTITDELSDFVSVIFLDADDEKTVEKSGLVETNNYIDNLMISWGWTNYDKYIFPNNHDAVGEVEDFLQNIINPNNSDIFDCWNAFENCLSSKHKSFNVPAKKSKIYVYHEALHGDSSAEKEKCKDNGRDFKDGNLWDLDVTTNEYLKPLKAFLDPYFI